MQTIVIHGKNPAKNKEWRSVFTAAGSDPVLILKISEAVCLDSVKDPL